METKKITFPEEAYRLKELKAGDSAELSGIIYTARDAAHKKICEMLKTGDSLGFELKGSIIYYCGPCPEKPGKVIGSCGPTTSSRMDKYAPTLLNLGLAAMIGKGKRSNEVKNAIINNKAVYFGAIGGAGALIADCAEKKELVAFPELGCEAVYRLKVKDMPLVVLTDSQGNDLYEIRNTNERQ